MMNKLAALMAAKKKDGAKPMSDVEKHAKMGVVKSLSDMANEVMKDHLDGLHKVSVASDSEEGLKHGLEKAHEVLEQHEMPEDESADVSPEEAEESPEEEAQESPEQEAAESHDGGGDDMDEAEIDKHLERLMKLKEAKKSKK